MSNLIEITSEEHFEQIKNSSELVMFDLWAEWCGPCRQTKDAIEKSSELSFPVYTVNVDNIPNIATTLGIRSIPAFLLFKYGVEVDRKVGAISVENLVHWFNQNR